MCVHREAQLQNKLAEERAERCVAADQLQGLQATLEHYQLLLEQADVQVHERGQTAAAFQTAQQHAAHSLQQAELRVKAQMQEAQEGQCQALLQHQQLLGALSQRDAKVAALAAELQRAAEEAVQMRSQASHLEGVVRSTGVRAAAAEEQASSQAATAAELQEELGKLKER